MSKTYQIHVNTSLTTSNTVYKYDNNPFNCSILLGQSHRRIRSVALKSAEIPIGYINIREPYNVFTYIKNDVTSSLKVTPGSFTSASLVTALSSAAALAIGAGTTFTISAGTNKITYSSGTPITILSSPFSLASMLGFTDQQTGTSILATNSYNINFDNYICIYIENLRTSSLEPNVPITFKIPITVGMGNIQMYSEGTQWRQKIDISDPNFRLDRLNIKVLDRFGKLLDNNGLDWSFTLEIESDT